MPYDQGDLPLLRAPTKTVTFTGAANFGSSTGGGPDTITIWNITGRSLILYLTTYISTTLVSAGAATIGISPFHGSTKIAYTLLAAGRWWNALTATAGVAAIPVTDWVYQYGDTGVTALITAVVGVADITAGEMVCDAFYLPLTSDASLT